MKTIRLTSVILLSLLLTGAAPAPVTAAGEPEVLAELAKTRIYEGESVQYTVTLNHVKNPTQPNLDAFTDFNVALVGQNPMNFSSTTIVNGRMTKVERHGMQYIYRLTPKRAGKLVVPSPVAKVAGKTLQGPPLALAVVPPQEQDVVRMQITSTPKSVYPMQPFDVTLSVFVRDLPGALAKHDPVSFHPAQRIESPALEIPWAMDNALPKGLEPRRNTDRWCQNLQSQTGAGFSMNKLATRGAMSLLDDDFFNSPFDSMFDDDFFGRSPLMRRQRGPRLLIFEPTPERVMLKDATGADVGYWRYDFTRRFIPKMIGQYNLGPASLKGKFLTALSADGQGTVEDVYAIAPAHSVTIKDVPLTGRPDSYMGAIGAFTVDANLTPRKAKVGDPMTLTVKMTGQGTLDNATPPDLASLPGMAEQFKIYDATEDGVGETREFTYSLRPLEEGIAEFPAIPVSYFDVNQEKYVTLSTRPMSIDVSKADKLASHQIVASRRAPSAAGSDLQAKKGGVFANITDLSAARDQTVRPLPWLIGLGSLAGAYLAFIGILAFVRHRNGNVALQRRQSGTSRAKGRLRDARAELKANRLSQGADHVQGALIGLVADMTDTAEAGMTPRDVEGRLERSGVEDGIRQRVHQVLSACDNARYGAADNGVAHAADEAEQLLKPLAKQLKSKKRF